MKPTELRAVTRMPALDRRRTHGMTYTSTYSIWHSMVQRCTNPKHAYFHRYGGRGITVCDRWLQFEAFLTDMGERPGALTLDRRDNEHGYEPSNCRWATSVVQNRNSSANRVLTHNGQSKCVAEWAEQIGICQSTLNNRLRRGWGVEKTLSEPINRSMSRGRRS